MFDVSGPLIVHVLLLAHGFMYGNMCLLILGILNVTVLFLPKTHR